MMQQSNITQSEKDYVLTIPFSGVKKEDISVHVEKGILFLSAKRHIDIDPSFKPVHEEFPLSKDINVSYSLGDNVDQNKIDAKMENGNLTVTLGKKEEALPKKISIS